ncbi:hypothetical protein PAGL106935_27005 [Paenibacillus glucanolyticus]|jgi:hypothetical protein
MAKRYLHEQIVKARRVQKYTQKEVAYMMGMTLTDIR